MSQWNTPVHPQVCHLASTERTALGTFAYATPRLLLVEIDPRVPLAIIEELLMRQQHRAAVLVLAGDLVLLQQRVQLLSESHDLPPVLASAPPLRTTDSSPLLASSPDH